MTQEHPPSPTAPQRFVMAIDGLLRVLSVAGMRGVPGPLVLLIWNRLSRLKQRFVALVAKIEAGTVPPPRVRAAGVRRGDGVPATPRPPDPLPRAFGWIIGLVGYHGAGWIGHTQDLLQDPQMQALISATPQMGRLLRPFCWMLGVWTIPEVLRPQPRRNGAARSSEADGATAEVCPPPVAAAPLRARAWGRNRQRPYRHPIFLGLRPVPIVGRPWLGSIFSS